MKCPFEYRKYDFLSRSFESVVDSATIAGYLLVYRFLGNSKDISSLSHSAVRCV